MRELLGLGFIAICVWMSFKGMMALPTLQWWGWLIYIIILYYFIKNTFNKYVDSTECEKCKNLIIRSDKSLEIEYLSVTWKHANADGTPDKRYKSNSAYKVWNDKMMCNKCGHITITKRNSNDGFGWSILFVCLFLIFIVYLLFGGGKTAFDHKIINGETRVVSVEKLNVRKGPDKNSKVIEKLSKNDTIIASKELLNGWVLIADKDTTAIGYVFHKYLSKNQ